jgi:hypothetical protein
MISVRRRELQEFVFEQGMDGLTYQEGIECDLSYLICSKFKTVGMYST